MPYVTSIERLAKEEGKAEGKAEGLVEGIEEGRVKATQRSIAVVLEARFGTPGKRLASRIAKITNLQQLNDVLQAAAKADRLAELRQLMSR